MAINDAVHWQADLGGGTRVALIQAGTFKSDAGTMLGPVPWVLWRPWAEGELDENRRLTQALNCLLVETPAGRVLIETGIGERMDDKNRAMRGYTGTPVVPALLAAGFAPDSVDLVAMSHLHYDHAGGLLLADGSRAFPRATIVAQRAEWEVALSDNTRVVASYDQPELRLVADWGAEGCAEGDRELLPGVSVVATGGHTKGHQAIVIRGTGPGARTVAFFGDLAMRPWSAHPRWITSFDDFPLDSVVVKAELFGRAVEEDWTVVLSHEARMPVGRLTPDRDRFRFDGM